LKKREPAYPVLIQDLLSSSKEVITTDEGYQRNFFVTITGAKVFRVVISGVLMDLADIGSEDSPIYRLRIADPTGGISFTVGRYSPELQRSIPELKTTYPIVVIGKVASFVSKRGEEVITINPETIRHVTKEERSMWNFLAVRDSMARLWKLEGRGPLPAKWIDVPRPDDPRGGEEVDEKAKSIIRDTLRFLDKAVFAKELERAANAPAQYGSKDADADPLEEYEDLVIGMINDLDRGSGTRWDELVDHVDRNRLSRDIVEEVVSNLLDKGLIYEPVLGYLKAI
jgi:RPA family protein